MGCSGCQRCGAQDREGVRKKDPPPDLLGLPADQTQLAASQQALSRDAHGRDHLPGGRDGKAGIWRWLCGWRKGRITGTTGEEFGVFEGKEGRLWAIVLAGCLNEGIYNVLKC